MDIPSRIALAAAAAALLGGPSLLPKAEAVPLSQFMRDTPAPGLVTYKTPPSGPLTMAVFDPPGWKPSDMRPAIVFIHGGAWVAGDAKVFFPHARYFASRGAVTISIEYRLAKPDGPGVPECLADCKSALRYLRAHAAKMGVDPDRIAAFGDSAGGHLAAALGACAGFDDPQDDLRVSAVPDALVLCNPIVDMTEGSWVKFVMQGDQMSKNVQPGDLHPTDAQTAQARALSPLFQIKPGQPPAVLMHGTDDHIVNAQQAQAFADADKKAGNRCDLIWMQGGRHAFVVADYTAPESVVVAAIRHADDFFVSLGWLRGPATLEVSSPPAWPPRK